MRDQRGWIETITVNKFRVRVSAGKNPHTGSRHQPGVIVNGTYQDAEAELERLRADYPAPVTGVPHTFDELFRLWDEKTLAQGKRKATTAYTDRGLYRNHIAPVFAQVPITSIRPAHLNVFYDNLQQQLAPASIHKIHAKIGAVLQFGVRHEYLHRNVASLAEPPRVPKIDPYAPEIEEVRELLDHMYEHDQELWLLYRLAGTVGLRRNEISALTYADIDLDNHTLRVYRSVDTLPGSEMSFSDTKTGHLGHATLMLDQEIVDVLATRRRTVAIDALECGISIDDVMVFPGRDLTTPRRPDSHSQKVRRYHKRFEHLPHITIKDLRSFVATELEHSGYSMMTAKAVMRHSSDATTSRYYVASRTKTARRATAAMGEMLQRRNRFTKSTPAQLAIEHTTDNVQITSQ